MRSDRPLPLLTVGAVAGLLFLHVPILIVFVYAFTTESATYTWPPPGFTTEWFARAADRADMWRALGLSLRVALFATATALILGTLAAAAVSRAKFFGRETVSLLVLLPIALPGITTAIALRSAFGIAGLPFSYWTIAIAHSTFCIVVIYNNAVARFRRLGPNLTEAAMDLGANGFQTFLLVILPNLGTALVAGAMLAFALSFDEVIVTIFTAGPALDTLPIWMLEEMSRPRERPVTNVVAMAVFLVTLGPILLAYYLTRDGTAVSGGGK